MPAHEISRSIGFHSRSVDARCTCGWVVEAPAIPDRERAIERHLNRGKPLARQVIADVVSEHRSLKPYDVALMVHAALKDAGYKIVRAPRRKKS